jgi:hypothetical protein
LAPADQPSGPITQPDDARAQTIAAPRRASRSFSKAVEYVEARTDMERNIGRPRSETFA